MDLLEALLLECQVAVQDFSQAWSYLIAQKLIKVSICIRVLQCDGIFSDFQYLMHTGINNYEISIIMCALKPSEVMHIVDFLFEDFCYSGNIVSKKFTILKLNKLIVLLF